MPKFSKTSLERLLTCHPDLQAIMLEIIKHYDITILCGHRGKEEQDKNVSVGKSKTQWPNSKHNSTPSMAVDVAPYPIDWADTKRFYYLAGYVESTAQRLYDAGVTMYKVRWGGDWDCDKDFNDNKFNDLVHFELWE